MKTQREIPAGWRRELDGSYSPPPKTAKQHNCASGVGEVTLDAGSKVGRESGNAVDFPVVTKPTCVGFKERPSRMEDALNKTEKRFLAILRGRHANVRIQAITLLLADACRYTADFSVTTPTRFTLYEVKGGFVREDAWIKLKTAARLYPEFTFVMAQYKGGTWTEKEIKP